MQTKTGLNSLQKKPRGLQGLKPNSLKATCLGAESPHLLELPQVLVMRITADLGRCN